MLFGKLMCWATCGKVNPLIGSAGVSAVPMAARVSQKVAQEENPGNFILMHSVGSIPHGAEIDVPLNYADYYFLEGLMRKRDLEK